MANCSPRIGYVPYGPTLERPGDRRRFVAYARARNLPFELAVPEKEYDVVILSEVADISVWSRYPHGKIIYDLIDSYLAIPRTNVKQWLRGPVWFALGRHRRLQLDYWGAIQAMCRRADAVICTTDEQKFLIGKYCPNVHIVLDVHGTVTQAVKDDYRSGDVFRLAWEGLPSNVPQLMAIRDVLKEFRRRRPVILNIVTDVEQPRLLGRYGRVRTIDLARRVFDNVEIHPWQEATCSSIIRSCDVAVIPIDLADPFVSGKPENKLLLLWRMGMPVIASATPAYRRAMQAIGLPSLACRDDAEWLAALQHLADSEPARREAGARGLAFAEGQCSDEATIARWDAVFDSIGYPVTTMQAGPEH